MRLSLQKIIDDPKSETESLNASLPHQDFSHRQKNRLTPEFGLELLNIRPLKTCQEKKDSY